jgi:hypothetical protein
MGSYAYQVDSSFRMPAGELEGAKAALIKAIDAEAITWVDRDGVEMSWVESAGSPEPTEPTPDGAILVQRRTRRMEDMTLTQLLAACDWELEEDAETGDVVGIALPDGCKYHDNLGDAMEAIAPFVAEDSFIEMEVDEEHWRWRFEGGELKTYGGWIAYGDDVATLLGDRAVPLYETLRGIVVQLQDREVVDGTLLVPNAATLLGRVNAAEELLGTVMPLVQRQKREKAERDAFLADEKAKSDAWMAARAEAVVGP